MQKTFNAETEVNPLVLCANFHRVQIITHVMNLCDQHIKRTVRRKIQIVSFCFNKHLVQLIIADLCFQILTEETILIVRALRQGRYIFQRQIFKSFQAVPPIYQSTV